MLTGRRTWAYALPGLGGAGLILSLWLPAATTDSISPPRAHTDSEASATRPPPRWRRRRDR